MILARLVTSRAWQSCPTWWWESAFAITYITAITVLAGVTTGQVISAMAVFMSFQHMSVASRLEEAQERAGGKGVACYRKLTRYLVTKEILWVAAFIALGAWTALAGVPLFLLYPVWRRAYLVARASEVRDGR